MAAYYTCPVCGFDKLPEPPERFLICPSCGTEFGNHDYWETHAELRAKWEAGGRKWWSKHDAPPSDWMKEPRAMRILVVCVHFSVSSGRYISRALRRLGHDVKTTGPNPGRMIWGLEVEAEHAWMPDFGWPEPENYQGEAVFAPAGALLAAIGELTGGWQPELIITADSNCSLDGATPMPHVIWGMDNHVRDYWPERASDYKALFLAHTWGARMSEPNAHWLPPCYDPEAHTDLELARDLDVVLVGYPYPERVELLEAMRAAGLNVLGSIGMIGQAYNNAYNRAKIALVRSACGDIGQRVYENMAQGCCVLSDRARDLLQAGFVAGVDYWPYDTAEEAVKEARWLLSTGEWRQVAKRGKRKVQGQTWDARANRLLSVIAGERYATPDALAGIGVGI